VSCRSGKPQSLFAKTVGKQAQAQAQAQAQVLEKKGQNALDGGWEKSGGDGEGGGKEDLGVGDRGDLMRR
jgi:hypothetical protein